MKTPKRLMLSIVMSLVVLGILYACYLSGWKTFYWNKSTPRAYLNYVLVSKSIYSKDRNEILKRLQNFRINRINPFHSEEYCDSTQFIIDTIIYSADLKKFAALVIVKNPSSRLIVTDETYDSYYDGCAYFGTRQKDTIDITWMGPFFLRSHTQPRMSGLLRDYFLDELAAVNNRDTTSIYKYNINDTRFWTCGIWKEIERKKQMKKEFEEEKRLHPENVSEPQ